MDMLPSFLLADMLNRAHPGLEYSLSALQNLCVRLTMPIQQLTYFNGAVDLRIMPIDRVDIVYLAASNTMPMTEGCFEFRSRMVPRPSTTSSYPIHPSPSAAS